MSDERVIDFAAARNARNGVKPPSEEAEQNPAEVEGYIFTGDAKCMHCQTEFETKCRSGETAVECPKCELRRGVMVWPFEVPPNALVYTCDCGGDVYKITTSGTFCITCGAHKYFVGGAL